MLGKGIVDRATIWAALTSPASKFVADPASITEATRAMQAYQVKLGTLDKAASLEGLFDHSFYLKAAEGEGGRQVSAQRLISRTPAACALGAALAFSGAAQAQTTKLEIGYVPVIGASPLFVLDGAGWAKDARPRAQLSILIQARTPSRARPPAVSTRSSSAWRR